MAAFHGKFANVIWDGDGAREVTLTLIQSWSASITKDVAKITSMQDTWDTFLSGTIDWTASVECLLNTTGSLIPTVDTDDTEAEAIGENTPVKLELYLHYATSDYVAIYGSAICTGYSVSQDKDGVSMISYSFQGTGLPALWADTTKVVY